MKQDVLQRELQQIFQCDVQNILERTEEVSDMRVDSSFEVSNASNEWMNA
jgi:hypothetical protein